MKKAVAVLVSVILMVNIFCVSASAEGSSGTPGGTLAVVGVDDAILGIAGGAIAGLLAGTAAGASGEIANRLPSFALEWANDNAIRNGEVIQVEERLDANGNHSYYYFEPVSGLTGDEAECAQFLSDYMNNSGVCEQAADGFQQLNTGMGGIDATNYAALKTEAVNAFTAYLEGKQREIDMSNFSSFMSELESAMGGVWAPDYEFSFVGPQPDVSLSGVSSYKNFTLDGFTFSTPMMFPGYVNGWYLNKAFCTTYAGDHDNNFAGTGFYYIANNDQYGTLKYMFGGGNNIVAVGLYFISNGELYITRSRNSGTVNLSNADYADTFYNQYGVSGSLSAGVPFGFYYTTDTSRSFNYTDLMTALRPDDYFIQSEDIDLAVPLSSDENLVKQWLSVIDPEGTGEHTLEIDSTGAITGIDSVDLTNIESLLTDLVNSTYDFSSFEDYLRRIATAAEAAGVNTGYIDDVLDALRAWEQAQDADLNDIKSNVQSIAQALSQEYDVEDDQHGEGNMYIVEHAGLNEAVQIVNQSMPFVDQMRTLVSNLFGSNNNNNGVSSAPNFHFYADLDHDGTNERYNAFDLSFLDTTLTNTNLEDKGRFVQPITVRELLQDIILLIVYSFFCLRMLKRIPTLINGSASDESTTTIIRS